MCDPVTDEFLFLKSALHAWKVVAHNLQTFFTQGLNQKPAQMCVAGSNGP